jgi:hypothetical protein
MGTTFRGMNRGMNGSYERYADLIRLYILPTFGEMQAAKLDA